MARNFKWFTTTAGVKLAEVVNSNADERGRVRVRKWRAHSRRWTSVMRFPAAELQDIPRDGTPLAAKLRKLRDVAREVP